MTASAKLSRTVSSGLTRLASEKESIIITAFDDSEEVWEVFDDGLESVLE